MKRLAKAIAAAIAALFHAMQAAGKGLFSAFLPSVPPAPVGDDDDEAPKQPARQTDGNLSLGQALILKRACAAVADGQKPDGEALKRVHPALAGWVNNLSKEEAKAVAGATCGQIRRHLTGSPCIAGAPNVAEAHLRATSGGVLTANQALAVVACCKRVAAGRAAGTLPISSLPPEAQLWLCTISDAEAAQAANLQPAELRAHLSGQDPVDGLPSLEVARQRHRNTMKEMEAEEEQSLRMMPA